MDAHERIARALRNLALSDDTALLDAVARAWVGRWPSLAAHDAGALPLLRCLRDWWLHDLAHAPLMTRDLELEGIVAGDRRACLKESVPAADADALVAAYKAMGFSAAIARRHGLRGGDDRHTDGSALAVVAVARDEATLADAVTTLGAHASGSVRDAILRMAALLGYPACCAEAFAAAPAHADNVALERRVLERAPDAPLHPLLQRLGRCRLVSHFPCRADCAASIALAHRAFDRFAALGAGLGDTLRRELEQPVLFLDYERRAVVELEDRPEGIWIVRAEPLGQWPEVAGLRGLLDEACVGGAFLARPGKPFPHNTTPKEQTSAPSADRLARFGRLFPGQEGDAWQVDSLTPAGRGALEVVLGAVDATSVLARIELDAAGPSFARVGRLSVSYPAGQPLPGPVVLAAVRALAARLARPATDAAPALVASLFDP